MFIRVWRGAMLLSPRLVAYFRKVSRMDIADSLKGVTLLDVMPMLGRQ